MKPKCPKCESSKFELTEHPISGAGYRYFFVVCSSCGCAISVIEGYSTADLLQRLAKKLGFSLD